MPERCTNILKHNHGEKSMKLQFGICARTGSLHKQQIHVINNESRQQ